MPISIHARSWFVCAWFVLAGAGFPLLLANCSGNQSRSCSNKDDCLSGELCQDGTCSSADSEGGNQGDASTPKESQVLADGRCVPTTCQAKQANCGSVPDGCGGTLECGSCAQGEACGANNKPNVCGKGTCQPKSCQQAGAQCGDVSDGCGSIVKCGNCQNNQTCQNNQCACQPQTCQALNKTCGKHPDGCGGEVDCGVCNVCEQGCPSGYSCEMGVCTKGNPKALTLNVKTFEVGGRILLNGANPKMNANCDINSTTREAAQIHFQEVNYGYNFTLRLYCKDVNNGLFDFKGVVFPGTYKVSVSGGTRSSLLTTDLPSERQVLFEKQAIQAKKLDFTLNVQTFEVGGRILLNGANPKMNANCDINSTTREAAQIHFQDEAHGYNFTLRLYCKDVNNGLFDFKGTVYPGTYKISVSGGTRSSLLTTDLPSERQVLFEKQAIQAKKLDFTLNVQTFEVGGRILLNGANPKMNANCDINSTTREAAQIHFQEVNYGYNFTLRLYCKDVNNGLFDFKGVVFPGTYKVSVSGGTRSSLLTTDLPSERQVLFEKQTVQAKKLDFTLNVQTFEVGGRLLLNGANPKMNANCDINSTTREAAQIHFQDEAHSYNFTLRLYCKNVNNGLFDFKGTVYPGTYKISVSGGTRSSLLTTDLPSERQVLFEKQAIQAKKLDFTLNVQTFEVGGRILLNGANPKMNANCDINSTTREAAQIHFQDEAHGYNFTLRLYCKDVNNGLFDFKGTVYPGTYKISVNGGTRSSLLTTDLPSERQVLFEKQAIQAKKLDFTLNVQTFEVGGRILLNGANPKMNANCDINSTTREAAQIHFQDEAYGYNFTLRLYCKDVNNGLFDFKGVVYPGTYKISVSGGTRSSLLTTDLPSERQVLVDRLRIP